MQPVAKPSKEIVRNWMQQRQAERKPVPTPAEARRALGWQLIETNKSADCAR